MVQKRTAQLAFDFDPPASPLPETPLEAWINGGAAL